MSAVEVTQAMVDFYHVHGAVKLPGLISREEAAAYREVAMELLLAGPTGELDIDGANQQRVQVWKWNPTLRGLTMLPAARGGRRAAGGDAFAAVARRHHRQAAAQRGADPSAPGHAAVAVGQCARRSYGVDSVAGHLGRDGLHELRHGQPAVEGPAQRGGPRPPAGCRQRLAAGGVGGGLAAAHHHPARGGRLHVSQRLHVPHGGAESHRGVARGPSSRDGGRGGGL